MDRPRNRAWSLRQAARQPPFAVGATDLTAKLALSLNGAGPVAPQFAMKPGTIRHCVIWAPLVSSLALVPGAALASEEEVVVLPPGSTLFLYTDGLVERRGEAIDEGTARAIEALVAGRHLNPCDLAEELRRKLLGDAPDDDVAFLLYRRAD